MLPETVGEAEAERGRRGRLLAGFPALHHRNFRLFVLGQGISFTGFWMQSVAQGWLVSGTISLLAAGWLGLRLRHASIGA